LKSRRYCATLEQMKNKISAVFFLFLLAQEVPASEIKAMAGMNLGKYLFSGEITTLNRQQKTGFDFGIGWVFDLNVNLKLEVNAFYSQKGAKASLAYTPETTISGYYKNSAINFPFFLKYKFKDKASPYIAFGPEFIFVTAHHLIFPETGDNIDLIDNTKKFLLAFDALLGYEWPLGKWGMSAEIRYSRRLGNFLIDPEVKVGSESVTFLLGGVYYL
jgi:hypothetical protein